MANHGVLLAILFALGVVGVGSARDLDAPMVTLQSSRPRARKLATATVWCVARGNLSDAALQGALDWVCGTMPDQGQVNCGPLQLGNACFTPDTVVAHSSWAFNSYFQSRNASDSACEFQGTGMQVTVDPSSSTCILSGSLKQYVDYASQPEQAETAHGYLSSHALRTMMSKTIARAKLLSGPMKHHHEWARS